MSGMTLVAGALSFLIGAVLGLLGGGGAILTLPMLVYVLGVDPKTSIAMSLFVVGATSLVGATLHARAKRVQWKIGMLFGAGAMGGAFAGGRLAHFVPSNWLLLAFAGVMLATAIAMMKGRGDASTTSRGGVGQLLSLGAAVGLVSGLVGAGGGFLIVPALTLLGGLSMRDAVGTSLFVITLQSFAGFAGHVGHVAIDAPLVAVITMAAMFGASIGAILGRRLSPELLRRGFAWLVLAMGLFMIARHLPKIVFVAVATIVLFAAFLVVRQRRPLDEPRTS